MTAPAVTRPVLSPNCDQRPEGNDVHASTIDREYQAPADCTYLHGAFGPGCPWCMPARRKS